MDNSNDSLTFAEALILAKLSNKFVVTIEIELLAPARPSRIVLCECSRYRPMLWYADPVDDNDKWAGVWMFEHVMQDYVGGEILPILTGDNKKAIYRAKFVRIVNVGKHNE